MNNDMILMLGLILIVIFGIVLVITKVILYKLKIDKISKLKKYTYK